MKSENIIENNRELHNKIAHIYYSKHPEIYNETEQNRLRTALKKAVSFINTKDSQLQVMDYGCGDGNLSWHLSELGLRVDAADITPEFLKLIKDKISSDKLTTLLINGRDLANVESDTYHMVASYSVLHHIPDYLGAIGEMMRVIKPGGVLYLDHDASEGYWDDNQYYNELKEIRYKSQRSGLLKRLFSVNTYIRKIKKLKDPRYQEEGDIHVWPDDHIEWDKIRELLLRSGFEIITDENYLLYYPEYPIDLYEKYKDKCNDEKLLIARKSG